MKYLTHSGTIAATRNVPVLWEVLWELNMGLKIVGVMDYVVMQAIKKLDVIEYGYVSHAKSIKIIKDADMLLLLINNVPDNKGIMTGKLYEYLAAHRPIMAIGPVDGEAAGVLRKTGRGKVIDYEDKKGMTGYLLSLKNWME